MTRRLSEPVICSMCGKRLRGAKSWAGGYDVLKHKGTDGLDCSGQNRADHQPVPKDPAR